MLKKDYKEELYGLLNEEQTKEFQKETKCLLPYAVNMVALAATLYIKYGLFTYFKNTDLSLLVTYAYEDWIDTFDYERKMRTGSIDLMFNPLDMVD